MDGSEVGGGGGAWNNGVPVTGVFLFTGDCITNTERETDTHGDLNLTTAIYSTLSWTLSEMRVFAVLTDSKAKLFSPKAQGY